MFMSTLTQTLVLSHQTNHMVADCSGSVPAHVKSPNLGRGGICHPSEIPWIAFRQNCSGSQAVGTRNLLIRSRRWQRRHRSARSPQEGERIRSICPPEGETQARSWHLASPTTSRVATMERDSANSIRTSNCAPMTVNLSLPVALSMVLRNDTILIWIQTGKLNNPKTAEKSF